VRERVCKKKKSLSETYEIHRTNNHKLKIILASRERQKYCNEETNSEFICVSCTYDCVGEGGEKSMRMQEVFMII
jgi:hypothetical protein